MTSLLVYCHPASLSLFPNAVSKTIFLALGPHQASFVSVHWPPSLHHLKYTLHVLAFRALHAPPPLCQGRQSPASPTFTLPSLYMGKHPGQNSQDQHLTLLPVPPHTHLAMRPRECCCDSLIAATAWFGTSTNCARSWPVLKHPVLSAPRPRGCLTHLVCVRL